MKAGRTIAALAVLVILVAAGAAAAGLGERFAHGSDRGDFPLAFASGRTSHPHTIHTKITTRPRHVQIQGKYKTDCIKGTDRGTRGNRFHGRTPLKKKLRLRFTNPDACEAGVLAGIDGRGRIKVELFAKPQ
jgi:hypothetical protein